MPSAMAGEPGLDAGVLAFRRLLERADDDDGARGEVFDLLVERTVLAATWPDMPDTLRTLTNAAGERAVPLFSERDTLLAAGAQFGWAGEHGAAPQRELSARAAMEAAIAQGIHYIVIDVCSDHMVELARDEVALMLAVTQKRRAKAQDAAAAPAKAPALVEIDMPFLQGRQERDSLQIANAVPRSVSAPSRPVVAPRSPTAETIGAATPRAAGSAAATTPRPEHDDQTKAAPWKPIEPAKDAEPARETTQAGAPPTEPTPPVTHGAEAPPPARPNADAAAPRAHPPEAKAPKVQPPAKAVHAAQPEPKVSEAQPLVKAVGAAEQDKPAAAATRTRTTAGTKPEPKASTPKAAASEDKRSAMRTAVQTVKAMLGADSAAEKQAPEPDAPSEGAADEDAVATFAEGALRPLELGLSDALLAAISDALREYPEVEWACEVSDGTQVPVLGVRVSPSFLTRVAEIERAMIDAATARGGELRVLVLTDPQLMRDARTHGAAFFPWRRRAGRK